jgi:helicase MOV-10
MQVIVVSTVVARNRSHNAAINRSTHLGLFSNPKRFNVAITRAKSLLIVVGDPVALASDRHWRALLRHLVQLKAYAGCDLPSPIVRALADHDGPSGCAGSGELAAAAAAPLDCEIDRVERELLQLMRTEAEFTAII